MRLKQGNLEIDMDLVSTIISLKKCNKFEPIKIYTICHGIDLFKNLNKLIWDHAGDLTEKELEGYLSDARMLIGKYLYDDEECKILAKKIINVTLGISNSVDFITGE